MAYEREDYLEQLMARQGQTRGADELAGQLETAWKRRCAAHRLIMERPEGHGFVEKDGDETGEYRVEVTAELIRGITHICESREQDLIKAGKKTKAAELRREYSARISRIHQR